jgi:hypothetical protein
MSIRRQAGGRAKRPDRRLVAVIGAGAAGLTADRPLRARMRSDDDRRRIHAPSWPDGLARGAWIRHSEQRSRPFPAGAATLTQAALARAHSLIMTLAGSGRAGLDSASSMSH